MKRYYPFKNLSKKVESIALIPQSTIPVGLWLDFNPKSSCHVEIVYEYKMKLRCVNPFPYHIKSCIFAWRGEHGTGRVEKYSLVLFENVDDIIDELLKHQKKAASSYAEYGIRWGINDYLIYHGTKEIFNGIKKKGYNAFK